MRVNWLMRLHLYCRYHLLTRIQFFHITQDILLFNVKGNSVCRNGRGQSTVYLTSYIIFLYYRTI